MDILIIGLISVWVIIYGIVCISISINNSNPRNVRPYKIIARGIYCYIFEHKVWVRWENFLDSLRLDDYMIQENTKNVFYISNGDYDIVFWRDLGACSVHPSNPELGQECLSTFDLWHSRKLTKILQKNMG